MKTRNLVLTFILAGLMGASVVSSASANQPYGHGDSMQRWCGDTLSVLERARLDADAAFYRGLNDRAYQILMQGLRDTQKRNPFGNQGPLTANAVDRGLVLGEEILKASQGTRNGLRTTIYFLFRYYSFIKKVAHDIDYPFYIPFRNCGGCRNVEEFVFEQRFVSFAKEQVEMVLDTLADSSGPSYSRHGRNPNMVFPVGSSQAFLRALEISSMYAAGDLRDSLWASRYSCEILDLEELARRVACNGCGAYYDEVDAVNGAYSMARDILARVGGGHNCHSGERRH